MSSDNDSGLEKKSLFFRSGHGTQKMTTCDIEILNSLMFTVPIYDILQLLNPFRYGLSDQRLGIGGA